MIIFLVVFVSFEVIEGHARRRRRRSRRHKELSRCTLVCMNLKIIGYIDGDWLAVGSDCV